ASSLTVGLTLTACGGGGTASNAQSGNQPQTVTVGVILPLSGSYAAYGQTFQKGADAAVQYLNSGHAQAKNIQYKLDVRDGGGTPIQDQSVAKQLSQGGSKFVLGDVISATGYEAEQTVLNQTKTISVSSVPVFTQAGIGKQYPWAYGIGGGDEIYEKPFVDYVKAHTKNGKVAVVYDNYQDVTNWGKDTATLAQQQGLQVSVQPVQPTATDATAQLRSLQASGADSLIIDSLDPLTHTILTGLGQIGWAPPVVVSTSPSAADLQGVDQAITSTLAGGPIPDTFLSATAGDKPNGLTATYFDQFGPLVGQTPGKFDTTIFNGSYLFDAMLVLDQAIAKGGSTDTTAVQTALDSGTPFEGVRAKYVYGKDNRTGPVTDNWGVYVVKQGCPYGVCQKAP
ncbi:MAG TPA: ABC transporter substrate-binding protein, partial [Amycolatopsis sp.]|nr:ABC transporter substrate-binding protein [Amycolatopsis sp.]